MPPNLLAHYLYLWELTAVRQPVETAWISPSVRRTFIELLVPARSSSSLGQAVGGAHPGSAVIGSASRRSTIEPPERTGFEPSVPPRKTPPSREVPRPTIVVSRDDLWLMTPCGFSVRHLSSATAERPFKSGTDGSNPVPSCGDSASHRFRRRIHGLDVRVARPAREYRRRDGQTTCDCRRRFTT